jgi:O-methyltransferase involved in polyketide biosynthesis
VAAKLPLLGGPGLELRAASYAAVVADLNQADWPTKLQAAGWDPSIPTVWVAEGLTYYLEEASLKALIQVGWVLKHQDHMG